MKKYLPNALGFAIILSHASAQNTTTTPAPLKDLRINISEDGSKYVKFTASNQVWIRDNFNNPGSLVNGYKETNTADVGLRRLRFQMFGQLTDKVFFYTQFGENNYG